ncbi:MAG: lysylphosphatidylglycerol synthase transmembrane domain-containing protein [Anaerolineae bacterium]
MRRRLASLLKLVLSLGLVALLLSRVSLRHAFEALAQAQWRFVGLALALYLGSVPLRALRWQALLRAKGIAVPFQRLATLYYVGGFFNIMLPTGIGGDAVRAYELARYTPFVETAVGTVLLDRAAGLVVLFCMAALALPFSAPMLDPWIWLLVLGLTAGSLTVLVALFWGQPLQRVLHSLPAGLRPLLSRPRLHHLFEALSGYDGRALATAMGISVAFNLLLIAVNFLIGLGLGVRNVTLGQYAVFVSLISASTALPISFGGWGVREGGYTALYPRAGVAAPTAVAMALTFDLINITAGLVGGVLYAYEGARGTWARKEAERA